MKYADTVASKCRYGDVAARIFGDADVIWESSDDNYQGFANVLAKLKDGRFCHYEWTYGSCSGCDEWESEGLSDDEIEAIMRKHANFFDDPKDLERYLHFEDKDALYPCANTAQNGSIPGMLRSLTHDRLDGFTAMRDAYAKWKAQA